MPALAKIHRYLSKSGVLRAVMEETGSEDCVQSTEIACKLLMTALYKYAGLNRQDTAKRLGFDSSTVSQSHKRLRDKGRKERQV